ncbi:hypothetical protein [Rhodovibrio salinarum]|uniref:Uncharacterized protein n=1 Tax=Rhodovibrio salinarum TaxID=1087 RepID=A0A934QG67_9PROT|nr:hypothetical protein [Rhodovibrio salinarum]MBK1696366.1 hypothetical protein [Rhodovibrio salinarum]
MTVTCALKINDRGPANQIVLTAPDGRSLVAPAGEYRVAFEPETQSLEFVDGDVRFRMPRDLAEHYHALHLISGRIPNDNLQP